MSTAVAPYPRLQFFDNSGDPLNGGKLYTYAAGTSTPLSTYDDPDLAAGNANPNPTILNSAGRPSVSGTEVNLYLTAAEYKFVLKTSADVILWTADYVPPDASGISSLPTTFVVGDLLVANSTTAMTTLPDVATGSVLASGGVGAAPAYSATPTVTSLTATTVTSPTVVASTVVTTPSVSSAPLNVCEGRLTATSAVPVTVADVSAATLIYFTPYKGNRIALYDGSTRWNTRTFTEITINLAGLTASRPYDIFAYDNAGTVTIETLIWTSGTARATDLTTQNGVLVKTGVTTRRYLGTVYINSSGGQTDDSMTKRFLWSYDHRVERALRVIEATSSWTYNTATIRQARATTTNQVEVMVGWREVQLSLDLAVVAGNANVAVQDIQVGIGENSVTVFSTLGIGGLYETVGSNGQRVGLGTHLVLYPAVGYSYYAWLEFSTAGATTTFYGSSGGTATQNQSGLSGHILG